jgi:hypothetical protein
MEFTLAATRSGRKRLLGGMREGRIAIIAFRARVSPPSFSANLRGGPALLFLLLFAAKIQPADPRASVPSLANTRKITGLACRDSV